MLSAAGQDRFQFSATTQAEKTLVLSWQGGSAGNLLWTLLLQAGGFRRSQHRPNPQTANMHYLPAEYRRGGYQGSTLRVIDTEITDLDPQKIDQRMGSDQWLLWTVGCGSDLARRLALLRHYWSNWRHYPLDPNSYRSIYRPSQGEAWYINSVAHQAWQAGVIVKPVARFRDLSPEQELAFLEWYWPRHDWQSWSDAWSQEQIQHRLLAEGSRHFDLLDDIVARPYTIIDSILKLGLPASDLERQTLTAWLEQQRTLALDNWLYRAWLPDLADRIGSLDPVR